ncbi:conserved hypothetical protein [Hahella chejuensis KCTC 2396]|uniref:Uncharacterized protein n=1 Tax=Hahella chejuensis (strain KCTC 2396) TaxID=349521 RepID=Q2SHR9_HAHCH|nr:hypothetical protein [Hahella chejuensis]ABC29805.1 conserved hypothetical protein [Hahella chejuensis KCTC 2396]
MQFKRYWVRGAALLALVLFMVGLSLVRQWLPGVGSLDLDQFENIHYVNAVECTPGQGECRVPVNEGSVSFSFGDEPIRPARAFPIRLQLQGVKADQIRVDFEGADMYMGLNQTRLTQMADGSYQGEGYLPVCITGRMAWRATIFIAKGSDTLALVLEFVTE